MDNPLSLCLIDSNGKLMIFLSFSDRPTIRCVAFGHWTEWFNYFYEYVYNIIYRIQSIYFPLLCISGTTKISEGGEEV